MRYEPFLILDEDDTPRHDTMTVSVFMETILKFLVKNGIDANKAYVKIGVTPFEEGGFEEWMGEIRFLEKIDG